ncbi:exonuclease DPD1, chloroplastic/mitochondrial isoform X2 [Henckelia pumila]|uniref:exonuclease DPD1, chloroplastic/mitochondrial isoform X2 n=1 Tax=Henckelia pumila TaxID=405737 RepID=UPI003C6E08F4
MRTAAMCFSLLQLPRCKIQTLANSWWGGFFKLSRTVSSTRVLCTDKYELERGQRWTRRTISTDTSGSKEKLTRKTSIRNEIISESKSIKLNTCKLENIKSETDQYYNDLAKNVTIICFDIETTGLSREYDRIIEIAFQDLRGGENSTFQTLVNPEREVTNARFHGISTHMVKRSNVPSRSSHEIPKDWLFADTLPLARALMKSKESKVPSKISLQALREHYNIPLVGSAHRALSDVHSLALVLQRLTYELKVPISDLIRGSFQ